MIIKDWWYAYKVCKKYGIKWNPFHTNKYAMFRFSYYINCKMHKSTIKINPFYPKGFMDSFMHEVGHILRMRRQYSKAVSVADFEKSTSDTLYEEYSAWKFAKRTRRESFNKQRAVKFFQTYFPKQAEAVGSIVAADQFYKMSRRIEK